MPFQAGKRNAREALRARSRSGRILALSGRPKQNFFQNATTVPVKMNGIGTTALLDSGAFCSCVATSLLARLVVNRKKFKEVSIMCRGFQLKHWVATKKVSLQLKIDDLTWEHDFLVLEDPPFPVILGVEFMKRSGMQLDFVECTYSFNFRPNVMGSLCDEGGREEVTGTRSTLSHLPEHKRTRIMNLFAEFQDVITDRLGCTNLVTYDLTLSDSAPVRSPPFQCTPPKLIQMERHIRDLLNKGVIKESDSSYASPAFLVPKKDGDSRLVVDYRRLNSKIIFDAFPLPTIENAFWHFRSARYFTILDLNSAYHQIPLTDKSKKATAFITPFGLYEYQKLPFGVCTGAQILSRLMERVLNGIKMKFAYNYLDDLVIYSDTFGEHIKHIHEVLHRLRKAGLTVNPKKMSVALGEIKFLGHIISSGGVKIDPDRARVVKDFPPPKNLKGARRFLGMCSFYSRFIPSFSEIAAPINNLKRKNCLFKWGAEQEKSFRQLKERISSPPVLQIPDFSQAFTLHTDASSNAVAAVLSQSRGGHLAPVAFASRALTESERKYSAYEAECLAVVYGVEKFEKYLQGREFELFTDNEALSWMFRHPKQLGKIGRWVLRLSPFKFKVNHVRGSENIVADCLSRMFNDGCPENTGPSEPNVCVLQDSPLSFTALRDHQQTDPECCALRSKIREGCYKGNLKIVRDLLVYRSKRGNRNRLYVPESVRNMVISYFHDSMLGAHLGFHKTKNRIEREFYWPNMRPEVLKYVRECELCQRVKPARNTRVGFHAAKVTERPWQRIYIDYVGPITRTRSGNTSLMVIIDGFTRYVVILPVRNMTAESTVQNLIKRVFAYFGFPEILVSDNAPSFLSAKFKAMCFNYGIKHVTTSPYYPQASLVERFNRNLKAALTIYHHDSQDRWDEGCPMLMIAFNSALHESTGCSPSSIFLGRELNHPLGMQWGIDMDMGTDIKDKNLGERWAEVLVRLRKVNRTVAAKYNLSRAGQPYVVGQCVVHRLHPTSSAPDKISGKLLPRWSDPLKITSFTSPVTVELGDPKTGEFRRRCHVSQLKPYHMPGGVTTRGNDGGDS